MRSFRPTLLALSAVAGISCRHVGPVQKAHMDENWNLVLEKGWVLDTSGKCAAIVDDRLPALPFEELEDCIKPSPTPASTTRHGWGRLR